LAVSLTTKAVSSLNRVKASRKGGLSHRATITTILSNGARHISPFCSGCCPTIMTFHALTGCTAREPDARGRLAKLGRQSGAAVVRRADAAAFRARAAVDAGHHRDPRMCRSTLPSRSTISLLPFHPPPRQRLQGRAVQRRAREASGTAGQHRVRNGGGRRPAGRETQSTVARYMCRGWRPPSQGWRTFLTNHADGIAAVDLFVLPTIAFQTLYCLVIVRHGRRLWLSFAVTSNPTAAWITQQITEAFPWDDAPRYPFGIGTSRTGRSSYSACAPGVFATGRPRPGHPGRTPGGGKAIGKFKLDSATPGGRAALYQWETGGPRRLRCG
jgi:hypothetical protein